MPVHLSFEDPTVIATYAARHTAEMAKGRLDAQGVRAVLAMDDAGGAYPQMQRTQGVRLVVAGRDAHKAWHMLDDMDMLPQSGTGGRSPTRTEDQAIWHSLGQGLLGLGAVVVVAAGIGWAVSGSGVAIAVAGLGFGLATLGGLIAQQGRTGTRPNGWDDGDGG